jgi:ech hydrogenase subunit F
MGMFGEAWSNLFKKPFTKLYPFEKYTPIKATRGRYEMDAKLCIHCGLCAKACPANAIVVDKTKKRNEININACILCYRCVDTCPKDCVSFREQYTEPTTARTLLVFEFLPKGQKPPEGAKVETKENIPAKEGVEGKPGTEASTLYSYTIDAPKPGPRPPM